jgi:hypothetical protein
MVSGKCLEDPEILAIQTMRPNNSNITTLVTSFELTKPKTEILTLI